MKKLIGKSVMTGQWLVRHVTCYAWVMGDDRTSPPRTRWCLREQRSSSVYMRVSSKETVKCQDL